MQYNITNQTSEHTFIIINDRKAQENPGGGMEKRVVKLVNIGVMDPQQT
jgi:hypothetical protein